ncbi:hypothetical protein D3Z63_21865 [Vibrio parahaemolyticus]|nr:hypothetical protein RK51_017675 [Vibrio parahaemolyticus]QGG36154.1 hypothetical protein GH799_24190 [Vibrio parahaemolyticus 10329]EGQ8228467.1 hypothetical protein [Vibrio parahaemolyticus]EGQ8239062.1 hypothetical protein [Vibrio parahaemolyticus]EGQ8377310.1 hypothetical protein [Vibrio parahaemolyticus]
MISADFTVVTAHSSHLRRTSCAFFPPIRQTQAAIIVANEQQYFT